MSMEDPANLVFRKRRAIQPRHAPSSQAPWLVVTLVGALVFILLIRSLLDRTGATTGSTPAAAQQQLRDAASETEASADDAYEGGQSSGGYETMTPASMVYRCVGRKGDVSLQSEPCALDQKTTRAVHAPPEPEPVRRAPAQQPPQQAGTNHTYQNAQAETDRDRRVRQCEIAKQERETTLAQVELARTYDLLQRLDNMVYEACKGL